MMTLYPAIKPLDTFTLEVDQGHKLYVESTGNPYGLPVIFIHDGPGGRCETTYRQLFDPELYHIILFDQRGCGQSSPYMSLENNTTYELVHDIETIRQHFNFEKCILFGDAWGALLALLYAQHYPQYIHGLILHGTFLGREQDIAWLYGQGANFIFPDCWEQFIQPLPESDFNHRHILSLFYDLLTGGDEVHAMGAAKAWAKWEAKCNTLEPCGKNIDHFADPFIAHPLAVLKCHYLLNDCFLPPDIILDNMNAIKHLPSLILHGRYDMICPLENAWTLHRSWPNSELIIIRDAGHYLFESATVPVLIHATDEFARRFL